MSPEPEPPALSFCEVVKDYGTVRALHGLDFDIGEREFFTLLGPSGCGKTTLLRLIAGFEPLSSGQIRLRGEDLSDLPAARRPVNTVFQHYALFPHLSVADNVGFGLRMLGWDAARRRARVEQMLAMVKLEDFAERHPAQLSGGQQQRVALARAMAPEPRVLLLDEPLSALDLKLRQAMRSELKRLQQAAGITFVFVTHDQEEALAMSDRIAVLAAGRVQQIDTPQAIYEHPVNAFVANFIGQSNVIAVQGRGGRARLPGLTGDFACHRTVPDGDEFQVSIRPEDLGLLADEDPRPGGFGGRLSSLAYLGHGLEIGVRLDNGQTLNLRLPGSTASAWRSDQAVRVLIDDGVARLLD